MARRLFPKKARQRGLGLEDNKERTACKDQLVAIVAERVREHHCEFRLHFFGETIGHDPRWWGESDVKSSFPDAFANWKSDILPRGNHTCKSLCSSFTRHVGVLLEKNLILACRQSQLLLWQIFVPILLVIVIATLESGILATTVDIMDPSLCTDPPCTTIAFAPASLSVKSEHILREVATRSNLNFEHNFVPLLAPASSADPPVPHLWCIGRSDLPCPGHGCPGCTTLAEFADLPDPDSCDLPGLVLNASRLHAQGNLDALASPHPPFVPLLHPCAFFHDVATLTEVMMQPGHQIQQVVQLSAQYIEDSLQAVMARSNTTANARNPSHLLRIPSAEAMGDVGHFGLEDGYILWFNASRRHYPYQDRSENAIRLKKVLDETLMLRKLRIISEGSPEPNATSLLELSIRMQWEPYPSIASRTGDFLASEYGALCFSIPALVLFHTLVLSIGWEQDSRLFMRLKLMGMLPMAYHFSWLVTVVVQSAISSGTLCVLGLARGIPFFVQSSPGIPFLIFFIFGISMGSFAMALTACVRLCQPTNPSWSYGISMLVLLTAIFPQLLVCTSLAGPTLFFFWSVPQSGSTGVLEVLWWFPPYHFAKAYDDVCAVACVEGGYYGVADAGLPRVLQVSSNSSFSSTDGVSAVLPSLFETCQNMVLLSAAFALVALFVEMQEVVWFVLGCVLRARTRSTTEARAAILADGIAKNYNHCRLGKIECTCYRCGRDKNYNDYQLQPTTLRFHHGKIYGIVGNNGAGTCVFCFRSHSVKDRQSHTLTLVGQARRHC